ncbi:type II secretion system F family protein [Ornithinimicrobium cryptoxanthini]|uniref:type II secretion system F family protein n=1 Tax=Ornithinimicrobium cryptoxanthini TaxID=2934161 RepID=UPI0021198900|nr:type II secretion system F family protein [Ornithinimicrobium cryptoxanthini]
MGDISTLILVAAGLIAIALPLLAYAFTARTPAARQETLRNLNRDLHDGRVASGPEVSGGGLVILAKSLTPMAAVRWIDRLLSRAGRPAAWPLERVLVSKLVLTAAVVAFGFLLTATNPSPRMFAFAAVFAGLAWITPELLLYSRGQERRQAIQEKLPDMMDQLTISVEAGLGFEAALGHVARHSGGPLSDELIRTLQDIQVGRPRRQAYSDLAERTHVKDLGRFVRALNQAESNGISIARVLSTQAREMRIKRRQRAEEKAMQIPVKVVFPLILFILPVLFIIVMGPGVLGIIEAFS